MRSSLSFRLLAGAIRLLLAPLAGGAHLGVLRGGAGGGGVHAGAAHVLAPPHAAAGEAALVLRRGLGVAVVLARLLARRLPAGARGGALLLPRLVRLRL